GVVTIVVRDTGDIAAVADAAQQTVTRSRLVSPTPPTMLSPEVNRSTDASGQVRLEFTNPQQPSARLVVRVIDQATARQEAVQAEQRFERASSYQADDTAVPELRRAPQPAARPGTSAQAAPTARPGSPRGAAEAPSPEIPRPPRVPQLAAESGEGTRPGTPNSQRRARAADDHGMILPPPMEGTPEVEIPAH